MENLAKELSHVCIISQGWLEKVCSSNREAVGHVPDDDEIFFFSRDSSFFRGKKKNRKILSSRELRGRVSGIYDYNRNSRQARGV